MSWERIWSRRICSHGEFGYVLKLDCVWAPQVCGNTRRFGIPGPLPHAFNHPQIPNACVWLKDAIHDQAFLICRERGVGQPKSNRGAPTVSRVSPNPAAMWLSVAERRPCPREPWPSPTRTCPSSSRHIVERNRALVELGQTVGEIIQVRQLHGCVTTPIISNLQTAGHAGNGTAL